MTIRLTSTQSEYLTKLGRFNNLDNTETIQRLLEFGICCIHDGSWDSLYLGDIDPTPSATQDIPIFLEQRQIAILKSTEYYKESNIQDMTNRIIIYLVEYIESQYDEYSEIGWSEETIFFEMKKNNQYDGCPWV